MATKVTLGKPPKLFAKFHVKFKSPAGDDLAIGVTFKYRTRSGYAQYLNEIYATSDAEKAPEGEKIDFVALFAKGGEKAVEKMLESIDSWDLSDIELNKENMMQLQDEYQAAIPAFGDAYRAACVEGKLGI